MRRRRFISLAAASVAAPLLRLPVRSAARAAGSVREVLSKGLVVIAEERLGAQTVAVVLGSAAGSREDGQVPGLSLMTSRLMFQGTSRRPSETALQRAAALAGGTIGRGTTAEQSFFSAHMPATEAELAFDLLADVVLEALLDNDALDRQKQIAFQELARRRADPNGLVADIFQAALFEGHPLGTPILGTPESLRLITREWVLAQIARFWSGANLVLTVVGKLGTEAALAMAERFFGQLELGSLTPRSAGGIRPASGPRTVRGQAGEQQAVFRYGFLAPGLGHQERYASTVLNALMSESSGRLFQELRTARGLAYVAGSAYQTFTDSGVWFATAGVDPQNLEEALALVRAEIERLREAPPEAEEVANKVSQIAGRQILAAEGSAARAVQLASQEILGTEPTEEFVRRIREVTPGDVHRVAQTHLDSSRALVAVVSPASG